MPRPSPLHPFGFACYTPTGEAWELATADRSELRRWLDALPLLSDLREAWRQDDDGGTAGRLDYAPAGATAGGRAVVGKGSAGVRASLSNDEGGSAIRVLRMELEQLRAKLAAEQQAARWEEGEAMETEGQEEEEYPFP